MDEERQLLEVGRIAKPHGLTGEVAVALVSNRTERLDPGSELWLENGERLVIERSRPHQNRHLVVFVGHHSREAADALRGSIVLAEAFDDPDELWVHDLCGRTVFDTEGAELGVVDSVEANPASDLLVLDGGGLIPLTFLVEATDDRLVVDPPPGLLDT